MEAERAMRLALSQARRASGRTFPNPPVGAVVFRGDRVLGRGYTRPAGGPHAEIVAMRRASARYGAAALRGASLAVTLEPCCHEGRTGPCTEAILDAGIGSVLVGHEDPNPAVGGAGLRRLRRAGLRVEVGVLAEDCRYQHRGFVSAQERGRPWVALKLAATLDGRIATRRGESQWITGAAARALVHRLRDRADAVMVGSRTASADDPQLTVRRDGRFLRCPVRVLVDGRLAVPESARLLSDAHASRTWILTSAAAPTRRRRVRLERGVRLIDVPLRGGHVDLRRALRRLARDGLTMLLVEGGGDLAAALLGAGLVDEIHWFTAPSLLGGDARAALGSLGLDRLAERPRLEIRSVRRVGEDLYLQARVATRRIGRRRAAGSSA
jgi:diaminohydroxyphosphoribosylaminopyrimidine deaminase/5-amino-6-(5-phosphoribosylamino)uracil reductase